MKVQNKATFKSASQKAAARGSSGRVLAGIAATLSLGVLSGCAAERQKVTSEARSAYRKITSLFTGGDDRVFGKEKEEATELVAGESPSTEDLNDAPAPKPTPEQTGKPVEKLAVLSTDWDAINDELRTTKSEVEALKAKTAISADENYRRGFADGEKKANERIKIIEQNLVGDAEALIKDVQSRYAAYRYPSAVVNGECIATLTTGAKVWYVLKNACVNVVKKGVSNNGEIDGIEMGLSNESISLGISNLDCRVGKAHIAFVPKPCGDKKAARKPLPPAIKKTDTPDAFDGGEIKPKQSHRGDQDTEVKNDQ